MFYKLSNTTDLLEIEYAFDACFKYPSLYKSSPIINGLGEQSLPIIKMQNPDVIEYGIWGLMPEDYNDSWVSFQNITNTLHISIDQAKALDWVKSALINQRCIILVSGFFTSYIHKGEVYPFYVYQKNHQPFALAGVFSQLSDGFLTVSLITSTLINSDLKHVHNLGTTFPIYMSANESKNWLSSEFDLSAHSLGKIRKPELKAHTISKEFYKNDIIFDSILEPAHYKDLPILSLK